MIYSAEQTEHLKLEAASLGIDPAVVADLIEKWGAKVLDLAVVALRQGISVAFVLEVLTNFGPEFLQFILNLMHKKTVVEAEKANLVPYSQDMISLVLNEILAKYQTDVLQLVFNWIVQHLKK